MTAQPIVYHFTLQSPWSYLGHDAFMEVVRRHGLRVTWKPMNLLEVFPESGGLPLAKRHPKRRAYRDIELQRWRLARGLPLNLRPAHWPLANTLADRCVVALAEADADPDLFVSRAFAALWAQEGDLADAATLGRLLGETGHDPAAVLSQAESAPVRTIYDNNATAALEAGVFGAPTYIRDGEPFWGQDRLALLEDAVISGRAPLRARAGMMRATGPVSRAGSLPGR